MEFTKLGSESETSLDRQQALFWYVGHLLQFSILTLTLPLVFAIFAQLWGKFSLKTFSFSEWLRQPDNKCRRNLHPNFRPGVCSRIPGFRKCRYLCHSRHGHD